MHVLGKLAKAPKGVDAIRSAEVRGSRRKKKKKENRRFC
jgi:hypothetical protein